LREVRERKLMKMKHGIFAGLWLVTFALAMSITPSQIVRADESVLNQQIAQAETPKGKPVTIRGKISGVERQAVKVTTPGGEVLVQLPDAVRITGVERAKLEDVKPGTFVGTAAQKQADGNLRALEVHIFPEEGRGTGEGQRPYDLQPGSTMTNANVEKVEQVAVEKVQGQMLTLKYKGGEAQVLVPPETPIVKNVPGDRALLKPGAGVVIPSVRSPDGQIVATRVSAGVGGIMPPM
jgi:hypothetical protein